MEPRHVSPTALLILLCAVGLFPSLSVLMLGPLLIGPAHEFQTSVAIVGQLAAASAIRRAGVCGVCGRLRAGAGYSSRRYADVIGSSGQKSGSRICAGVHGQASGKVARGRLVWALALRQAARYSSTIISGISRASEGARRRRRGIRLRCSRRETRQLRLWRAGW